MKSRTKAEEILILRNAATQLGAQSYLGPWLESIIPEAESLLLSDIRPDITLSRTIRRCEEIVADAQRRRTEIGKNADQYAAKTIAEARQTAGHVRAHLARSLREALDKVTL